MLNVFLLHACRSYTVLDHLADMSGNLRQWDMEKDLQSSLAIEVKKLKEQLRIAEERLEEQRNRVSTMGPKISTARQKINVGRRECFKLSKICTALGSRLLGKNYKYASVKVMMNVSFAFCLFTVVRLIVRSVIRSVSTKESRARIERNFSR